MFLPSLLLFPMGPDEKAYSMYTGVSEMEERENRVIFDVRAENFLKLTKKRDLPGSLMVTVSPSKAGVMVSILDQRV